MKKLLSSISMAALSVCLILHSAHAMKRELEDENKEVASTFSVLPLEIKSKIIEDTFLNYSNFFNPNLSGDKTTKEQISPLRLVNHEFKRIIASFVPHLDLSGASFWLPPEARPQNGGRCKDCKNNVFAYECGQLFIWDQDNADFLGLGWSPCRSYRLTTDIWPTYQIPNAVQTLWTSPQIYYDRRLPEGHRTSQHREVDINNQHISNYNEISKPNPFRKRFTIDLADFTGLTSLNLQENTAITDDTLKNLTTLKMLNLTKNEIITAKSIRLLTKLEGLDLTSNKQIESQEKRRILHKLYDIQECYNILGIDEDLSLNTALTIQECSNILSNLKGIDQRARATLQRPKNFDDYDKTLKARETLEALISRDEKIEPQVKLNDLYPLKNLKKLVVSNKCTDIAEWASLPNLRELYSIGTEVADITGCFQLYVDIIDSLFLNSQSYKLNNIETSIDETNYKKLICILHVYNDSLTSKLVSEEDSVPFRLKDMKKVTEAYSSGKSHEDEWEQKYAFKLKKIANNLLKLHNRELKIYLEIYDDTRDDRIDHLSDEEKKVCCQHIIVDETKNINFLNILSPNPWLGNVPKLGNR